jgi:hypothetical protein
MIKIRSTLLVLIFGYRRSLWAEGPLKQLEITNKRKDDFEIKVDMIFKYSVWGKQYVILAFKENNHLKALSTNK